MAMYQRTPNLNSFEIIRNLGDKLEVETVYFEELIISEDYISVKLDGKVIRDVSINSILYMPKISIIMKKLEDID